MKRLILVRHAKSDWSMELDDHARPLNKRGLRSAKALGEWLRSKGYLPDEVLCSTATRTRETLAGLGVEAATEFDRALYHAPASVMLETLQAARADCVLMIGHNPGIAAFARALPARAPAHPRFADYPTCATLVVDFDSPDWSSLTPGSGRVLDFVVPRELTE